MITSFTKMHLLVVASAAGVGQPPVAPSFLGASVNGSTVSLDWSPSFNFDPSPTTYLIEAGSASGLANLATIATAETRFTAAGVGNGTYYIRVRAVNRFGTSAPSNEIVVNVSPTSACGRPPLSPIDLRVSVSGATVKLSWTSLD